MQIKERRRVGGRGALAALCCLALFLFAVYLEAVGILLPELGRTFRLGPAIEGRIFPASFGGYILGVVSCGILSDRLGRKRVLLGTVLVYAVALGLAGFAHSFGMALTAFALIGAGGGAMETVASALAADLYPEKRAAILNALQIAFSTGAILSPLLAQKLLVLGADWHRLFLGVALANFLLLALLAVQKFPALTYSAEALDGAALKAVLTQPAFLILCAAQALYVGAEVGLSSWLPSYFGRLPGGAAWSGVVVSGFWLAVTLGRAAVGGGVVGLPLTRLAALMGIFGAAASGAALLFSSTGPVLVCIFGTGLCFSGIFGLVLAETGNRYSNAAGTVFGGVVAAGGVGGAVVPWAIGALTLTAWGWRGALALIPVSSLVLGLLLLSLEKRRS